MNCLSCSAYELKWFALRRITLFYCFNWFFAGEHWLFKRLQSVKSKRFVLKELKCKRSKESVTRISLVMQDDLAHCLWTYLCPLLDHYCLAPYKCPLFDHCCLPTLEASFWLCEYLTRLSCPLRQRSRNLAIHRIISKTMINCVYKDVVLSSPFPL